MQLRRSLRLSAAVTLLLQSAWLFALVPRDCCAAHEPAAQACHEEVAPAPHCPMRAADGAACPMHRSADPHPARGDCSMRGSCNGPMDGLLTLLSVQAVLPESPAAVSAARAIALGGDTREQLITQFSTPDSPPPRA